MSATPIIAFEGVSKRFGATLAVDDVSLAIGEGEFFALLGPSGCGKTTLLRMLAGFEAPSAGRILIDGRDVAGTPPNRRPVNMVFQSYAVFPHMSVAENVAFGLKVDRTPATERRARVEEALALVKLDGLGARRPHQLSGGQKQRVALARALVKRPRVLLLDEPLSALDAKLRGAMRAELAQLQKVVGITFLFVTHDQEEAMVMAGRCAVMNAGALEQVASPADLYARPRSRFVADFIGQVNLFEGRVTAMSDGRARFAAADLPGEIEAALPEHDQGGGVGAPAWLAVRPEEIDLMPPTPGGEPRDGAARLPGILRGVAYLGSHSALEVELTGGRTVRVLEANRAGGPAPPRLGAPVSLAWRPEAGRILWR
jgi:spermidine/putrescine transport system ATP-binding protein